MPGHCCPNTAEVVPVAAESSPINTGARTMRILIAEDEAIAALDLETYLLTLGHEVVDVVSTGPAAVAAAVAHRPDVVFMDIRLDEGTNGIDAALEIRSRLDIPAIFLTAHTDPVTHRNALAARPIDYLVKPYARGQIDSALRQVLQGTGGASP